MKRRSAVVLFLLFFSVQQVQAQSPSTRLALGKVLSADSLASGNLKDILVSFFQLSFNNLTGPNKELSFASNPFALMLKNNPDLAIDHNYKKYKQLRKLNFGFSLRLDTSYRFSGFSFGLKYAIINQRDSTTSSWLFNELGKDSLNRELSKLSDTLFRYINTLDLTQQSSVNFMNNANLLLNDRTTSFNSLDTAFQRRIRSIAKAMNLAKLSSLISRTSAVNIRTEADKDFTDLKKALQKKILWTVNLSDTTYKDQFAFSNLALATHFSKGVFKQKPGSNLELDIKAALNLMDDTSRAGHDLKRCVFNFDPGFNWVIRNKSNEQSWLEMKFGGTYRHNFSRLYSNEQRDQVMFSGTFRLRIIADIWVPLEFRYDPKSGNVFGFLNVRANFSTLGNVAKGK